MVATLFSLIILASGPVLAGSPEIDDAFWKHWGDGQAEISSYDLVFPRYGELRSGTAVAVFVTETFSDELRVKADPGQHPASDEFPVMKLNLVQDFPTGIYDYNLMTSSFCALTARDGRPVGSPTKVSFSSQEWCGQVFHQILPRGKSVHYVSHSYFDGEADRDERLTYPKDAVFEDLLFHWARGLASPVLAPGESVTVKMLRSAEIVRLWHVPAAWEEASLARGTSTVMLEVPGGVFRVEELTATVAGELARTWTFWVEAEWPHRLIRWERDDGLRADLIAVERIPYWQMNANRFEVELGRIGLSRRPARTP